MSIIFRDGEDFVIMQHDGNVCFCNIILNIRRAHGGELPWVSGALLAKHRCTQTSRCWPRGERDHVSDGAWMGIVPAIVLAPKLPKPMSLLWAPVPRQAHLYQPRGVLTVEHYFNNYTINGDIQINVNNHPDTCR